MYMHVHVHCPKIRTCTHCVLHVTMWTMCTNNLYFVCVPCIRVCVTLVADYNPMQDEVLYTSFLAYI